MMAAHRDVFRVLYSMAQLDEHAVGGAVHRLEEARARGMARMAERLGDQGLLRDGVTVADANSLIWMYGSFDAFDVLYTGRGLRSTRSSSSSPRRSSARSTPEANACGWGRTAAAKAASASPDGVAPRGELLHLSAHGQVRLDDERRAAAREPARHRRDVLPGRHALLRYLRRAEAPAGGAVLQRDARVARERAGSCGRSRCR